MKDKQEYLDIPIADAEFRADDNGEPRLIGYASKYGNWYKVWDFDERIAAGAFDAVLKDKDTDVIASMNHDVNFAFARQSAGTLRLRSNSVGLQYEADITDDDGRRVHAKVKNGTIKGSSFQFSDVDDVWEFKENERPRRTITRVGKLYELGPVVWPANSAATVKARAAEILAEARQRQLGTDAPPGEGRDTGDESPDSDIEPNAAKPAANSETNKAEISQERQRAIERGYRKAGRIINRIRQADA